jgi:hypothetical protein
LLECRQVHAFGVPKYRMRVFDDVSQTAGGAASPTFAPEGHFRLPHRRIPFAFNGGIAETGQVKTLPLF